VEEQYKTKFLYEREQCNELKLELIKLERKIKRVKKARLIKKLWWVLTGRL